MSARFNLDIKVIDRAKRHKIKEEINQSINQHVIFSINRLINTVTNDNMEWTKPKPKYRHKILIKQSI